MKITYAGIPLLFPDEAGEIKAFVQKHFAREFCYPPHLAEREDPFKAHGCFEKQLQAFNYSKPPEIGLNEWYFPSGAMRWGYGFFLASASQRNLIMQATSGGQQSDSLIFDATDFVPAESATSVKFQKIWMLTPRPLGYTSVDDEFWIIPLVDDRYWWQFKSVNLTPAYITSWLDTISAICTGLGVAVSFAPSSIHADFLWPDKVEFSRMENGAKLLDVATASVGLRVAYLPNGTVEALNAEEAYKINRAILQKVNSRIAGRPSAEKVSLPSSIGLQFSETDCDRSPLVETYNFNSADFTQDFPAASAGHSIAGTAFVISSSIRASETSPATVALASALAKAVYGWWTTGFDFTLIGTNNWAHGLEDYVLYQFHQGPHGYAAQTRIVSFPQNCWIMQHLGQLTDEDRECECHPTKYVQAKEVILPGEEDKEVYVMEWNDISTDWVETAEIIEVSDPLFRNCLLIGERAQVQKNRDSIRWELVGSQGLLRQVRAYEDIAVDATGVVWLVDEEQVNILQITIENQTGEDLNEDGLYHAEYLLFETGDKWVVRIGSGGGAKCQWFLSPELGLPAADWDEMTATLTPTSTVCNRMEYVAGELVAVDPPEAETILNASHLFAIPEGVPFKAIEIADEWYAIIEHPVLVPLQLTQTGSGTSGTPEDYRYTVDDLQYGDQWTDVDIVATPHKYKRPEGNVQAATFGLGYRDWANDELVIMWTNERGLQSVRPLSLSQTGGADGDGSTVATWTYSVTDLLDSGNNLSGVDPTASPHKWRRTAGLLTAATAGLGYLDTNGDLVITWINEYPSAEECE